VNLLVTGGAGFMGSDSVRYWVNNFPKDTVVVLDKLTYAGNLENLDSVENAPNYKFIKGDICDERLVNKIMKRVDVVVHFAAESHVDRSILEPGPFIYTNIVGTSVLLNAALRHKVERFHHISTDEVFGALPLDSKSKFTEETTYKPNSPYSASKAAADHLVRAYHKTYGLPVTISNSSNNFGPYQFPEKFIPLTVTNALGGKKIPVYGDGLYVRDWLYVRDHTCAVEAILRRGRTGETYLISADHEYPNVEVVKKILDTLKKDHALIKYVKDRPAHDRKYALDGNKIRSQLGWKPKFSDFNAALEETVRWYKENRGWWERVKNKEYLKYYEMQYAKR
jgi:dTDP-glucose 4,6-dehydratase